MSICSTKTYQIQLSPNICGEKCWQINHGWLGKRFASYSAIEVKFSPRVEDGQRGFAREPFELIRSHSSSARECFRFCPHAITRRKVTKEEKSTLWLNTRKERIFLFSSQLVREERCFSHYCWELFNICIELSDKRRRRRRRRRGRRRVSHFATFRSLSFLFDRFW